MRLVKVTGDESLLGGIKQAAFNAGIDSVSILRSEKHSVDGAPESKISVEVETSTPKAKHFISALMAADFFEPGKVSIAVRQPRAVFASNRIRELTRPLEVPGIDMLEELWQFSHITYGLVGRVLIAGVLLGYGLIGQRVLLILAGLFFLPMLPMLMAIGFGMVGGQAKLSLQGLAALAVTMASIFAGAAIAATFNDPPMRYNEFSSFWASLAISTIVGIAAGLAAIDDVGRRELIGLAAAAQIGILPAWLGVVTVFGPPPGASSGEVQSHILSLFANTVMIIIAAAIVLAVTGVAKNVSRVKNA